MNNMNIGVVREKYPDFKISFFPKEEFLIGITDTKYKKRRKDKYKEVYLAKDGKNLYYLLYPSRNWFTGNFVTREKAIDWFKNGGR